MGDFKNKVGRLSHEQLKLLASLCAGAALLVGVALLLSGHSQFLSQLARLAFNSSGKQAAAVTTYSSNGTYQWTDPAGVTSVWVTVVGGGGGAGGNGFNGDGCAGAGGGSGGLINNQLVTVVPGQQYTVVVGTGGTGGVVNNCLGATPNSQVGGSSSFGALVATGGGGGTHGSGGVYAGGGSGGTPGGVKGQDATWYECGPHTGGTNGSGYGNGGSTINSCYTAGGNGRDGAVLINTSPVTISAAPQAVTSGGSSAVSWAAANVDANSCSVTGPSGAIITAPAIPFGPSTLPSGTYYARAAFSSDGTKAIIAAYGGYVYISTTGGATWTQQNTPGSRQWNRVVSSTNGTYLAAAPTGGDIWTSSNGGASWTDQTTSGSRTWFGLTSSSDGSHLAAAVDGGDIWTSSNYGTSWTDQTLSGSRTWYDLASSADGSRLVANVYGGDIYVSSNYGVNWTDVTSSLGAKNWYRVASDSTGQYLVAAVTGGDIYVSSNYGAAGSWTDVSSSLGTKTWYGLASSQDGTHLVAAANGNNVYVSTNRGSSWAILNTTLGATAAWYSAGITPDGSRVIAGGTSFVPYAQWPGESAWIQQTASGARNWITMTSSQDGSHLVATVSGGDLWASSNYGASWTDVSSSLGAKSWLGVASDSTGQYVAATAYGGDIYTSSNYGASWTAVTSLGAKNWYGVASDSTGQHLAAVVEGGDIYTSSNYGASWTDVSSSLGAKNWVGVASSGDGSRLVAGVYAGDIYVSSNYGASWTDVSSSLGAKNWYGVASDSTGQYVAATAYGGDIYTSSNYGASWTAVTSLGAKNWYGVASDSTGQYVAAAAYGGDIYTSSNYGASWTDVSSSLGAKNWYRVASDSTGQHLVIGGSGTYIYTYVNDRGTITGTYNASNITSPQTYTINCTAGGLPVSASTTITMAIPTLSLTANPTATTTGATSQLTWVTSNINANSCSVTQTDPSGATSTLSAIGVGDNTSKITAAFSASGTYTYNLACTIPYTSGNNATLVGSPTTGVAGELSQAITLNGTSQYASVPSAANLNLGTAATVSVWVNPAGASSTATGVILEKGSYPSANYGLSVYQGAVNMESASALGVTKNIWDGQWHNIVGVFNGSASKEYIDGTLVASGNLSLPTNSNALTIGSRGGSTNFFNGSIDDVRIYNRALSAAEVSTLYTEGQITGGLAGYWPFDTVTISGTTAYDLSGGFSTASASVTTTASDICTDITGNQSTPPTGCQTPNPSPGLCIPSGYAYNGLQCVAQTLPTVSLSATRAHSGSPATLSWNITGSLTGLSCSISGTPAVSNPNVTTSIGSTQTGAITAPTNYTLSCGTGTATTSVTATAGLVPAVQEI